jgi:hypothetical protein
MSVPFWIVDFGFWIEDAGLRRRLAL